MANIALLLEAEKRGILPEDKKGLLDEARKRGLVPGAGSDTTTTPTTTGKPGYGPHPILGLIQNPKLREGFMNLLKTSALPTAGAGLGTVLGGLGGPAAPVTVPLGEMAGSAGGEYLNQKLGLTPKSTSSIALSGAVPGAARGLSLGFQAAKKGLAVGRLPERLYSSAVKGLSSLPRFERAARVRTGLNFEILPTDAGLSKLGAIQGRVRGEVDRIINQGFKAGETVDSREIVKRLESLKQRYAKLPGNQHPDAHIDAVNKVENEFLGYEGVKIDVRRAQDMKKMAYRKLDASYDEFKFSSQEADKQITRGIKEELETLHPELRLLNSTDKQMIALEKSINRAVGRIESHEPIGIGTPIQATAAASVAGPNAGKWALVAKTIMGTPKFRAELAFDLNKARLRAFTIRRGMGLAAEGAYQAARSATHKKPEKDLDQ